MTIDRFADVAEEIAGMRFERRHEPEMPKGVLGLGGDNTHTGQRLGRASSTGFEDGARKAYEWI